MQRSGGQVRDRRRSLAVAAAIAALAASVAWWNRHQDQYAGLAGRYRRLARYLAGEGDAPLLTYPAWGYPWLLGVLPRPELTTVALQVALAVATLLWLRRALLGLGIGRGVVDLLCVTALPWYALASLRLADPWAAALAALGALALARAIEAGALRWAVASGVAFGLGLHARSELLGLLPAAALASFLVTPARIRRDAPAWAVAAGVAFCLLLPWGWLRVQHGAPFGLTSTNAGMVLYNSLGFHGNAWGIVASDALRKREARERFGPETDPASAEASRWFRERALAAIRERPLEFARKAVHNFTASLKFGFYGVEIEARLSDERRARYEVLKEQLKRLAGAKVNPLDVERYRRAGLWQDDFSLRSVPLDLWAAAGLPLANAALSAAYLLALLAALAWCIAWDRRPLAAPLVRVFVGFTVAAWGLLCLLQYEPRQANVLHFFGLPLVALGADALWRRRRRAVAPEASLPPG